ncbi:hypothetical protein ELH21_09225 [Rhizobium leguminosarum]|uniref:hypothetical protein n=1 Tax=Rhizobium leguminosarum TaxID=384 RepID=UPI00102F54D3|nr:hypothetical protein [Rhizobium leguminosarum]TBD04559.1 hypothetical protein ELH21_09225 [Rhizobium leguminosarum]
MIDEAKDEELIEEPPHLPDLYSRFCSILQKSDLVRRTETPQVVELKHGRLRSHASSVLAVALTLSLFQDEFLVDFVNCNISLEQVFGLAISMKKAPDRGIFDAPFLSNCQYLPNNTY